MSESNQFIDFAFGLHMVPNWNKKVFVPFKVSKYIYKLIIIISKLPLVIITKIRPQAYLVLNKLYS